MPFKKKTAPVVEHTVSVDLLDKVVALIAKRSKRTGAVVRLDDPRAYEPVERVIPTGLPALDAVFGVGGLPGGKIVHISGMKSTGKSSLSMYLVAQAQRAGWIPLRIDKEASGIAEVDREFGVALDRGLGADPSEVHTIEDAWDAFHETLLACRAVKIPMLGILDSVAAALTKEELDLELDEEGRRAAKARFLSKRLPQMVDWLGSDVCFILINQVRMRQDAKPFQDQTYTPGGFALDHYPHVHLRTTHLGRITKGEEAVGIKFGVQAIKNKVAPPFRKAELELYFSPMRIVDPATQPLPARPRVPRTPVTNS